ncbi:MAG: branched-chain amino acid ABC transporter permease [Alphaproteobacteria bacterium]|nr:branched-chain amino acid ABC transporter permease [Alphaproteobacteria bacterium]
MTALRAPLAIVGVGIAALIVPEVSDTYYVTVAFTLCMWIALTQSWTVLSGMAGYISLGHVVFYGLGGYVVVVAWQTIPLFLSIPLAGLATGAFALLIGSSVLRVRGPYFVILTFGIAELVKYILLNLDAEMGQAGRFMIGLPQISTLYYIVLGLAVAATLMVWGVRRSKLGAGLIAIREDEEAAETIGVPVARYKVYAYVLSAIIPGMVGGLMGLRNTYMEVVHIFNPAVSFTIVTMAIIGGSNDLRGPVFGALFLTVLSEFLWSSLPQLYMIVLGTLLIAFVLYAPNGIVGLVGKLKKPVGPEPGRAP